MQVRAAAARVINEVLDGKSLADCLPAQLQKLTDGRDQALLQAVTFGVCRQYYYLAEILPTFLAKPLKAKDQDIYALLLVGLYQLKFMRIPAFAAVAETVAATKAFKKLWAKNLVNAVLRNFQRHTAEIALTPAGEFAHPLWLIEAIKTAWPTQWQTILTANNAPPPLALRVNQQRITREAYLKKLSAENIVASIIPYTTHGIVLAEPCDVKTLPGFSVGEISVQDGAAQLAAELLALAPNLRVLDACAAPGGKTAHIAEQQPDLATLLALDQDEKRMQRVQENLQRLHLSATCEVVDATVVSQWWDGNLFARILLDAPCSATGVIRRHPDIKLLREATDIADLTRRQTELLNALWPTLSKDGLLLYVTCSVLPAENTDVILDFLAHHNDAKVEKMPVEWGIACAVGRQILPDMYGMDGFYYALLRKC